MYVVYFIKPQGNDKLVKIGRTKDLDMRLKNLQVGYQEKLVILGAVLCLDERNSIEIERQLHQVFKTLRVRGEWFTYAPRLRDYINAVVAHDMNAAREALKWNAQRSAHEARKTKKIDDRYNQRDAKREKKRLQSIKQSQAAKANNARLKSLPPVFPNIAKLSETQAIVGFLST